VRVSLPLTVCQVCDQPHPVTVSAIIKECIAKVSLFVASTRAYLCKSLLSSGLMRGEELERSAQAPAVPLA
jgi:hypothetical protein